MIEVEIFQRLQGARAVFGIRIAQRDAAAGDLGEGEGGRLDGLFPVAPRTFKADNHSIVSAGEIDVVHQEKLVR